MEKKLGQKLAKIRKELQETKIKKSGKNPHARFNYFELSDFLPEINRLCFENGVNHFMDIRDGMANIVLESVDSDETFISGVPYVAYPVPVSSKSGKQTMQEIQYQGALITYYKRYVYMNAFGITDGEIVDSMDNKDLDKPLMNEEALKKAGDYMRKGGSISEIEKKYTITEDQRKWLNGDS